MEPEVTQTETPTQPRAPKQYLRWPNIINSLKQAPGEWIELVHSYKTDQSARVGVYRAAVMYGFDFRVTARERKENGQVGIYLRWPTES